jgi:cell division protein FtsL
MKNDSTTTVLNFVLAALVILGVLFAMLTIWRTHELRHLNFEAQQKLQQTNYATGKAQALLNDAIAYNATARNPEMAQIIQMAETPVPAAKQP